MSRAAGATSVVRCRTPPGRSTRHISAMAVASPSPGTCSMTDRHRQASKLASGNESAVASSTASVRSRVDGRPLLDLAREEVDGRPAPVPLVLQEAGQQLGARDVEAVARERLLGHPAELVVAPRVQRHQRARERDAQAGGAMTAQAQQPSGEEPIAVPPQAQPAAPPDPCRASSPQPAVTACATGALRPEPSTSWTSGSGTMNLPPPARKSFSRSTNSSRKCQGSAR